MHATIHTSTQALLPLALPFKPLLHDVRAGLNTAALHAAQRWLTPPERLVCMDGSSQSALDTCERLVLCWGAQGVGKTLLSHALVNSTPAAGLLPAGLSAMYLSPASTLAEFESAAAHSAVVLDDVHALNPAQAVAAFNLYNHIRENSHQRWWATSRVPPSHMTSLLPDLASRMAWGLVFELLPLGDDDSVQVLQAQSLRLGFELSLEAAHYLLVRLERNLAVLVQHLASLNRYALTLKKPVTRHLVQQWHGTVYLPALHKN